MIFLAMLGLAALLMLPLAFAFTGRAAPRARRDAALAIHRAQLGELARDLAEARIPAADHAAARLEIERRLLAADGLADPSGQTGDARPLLIATLLAIPVMAFALYLPGATYNVPSEPHARWLAQQHAGQQRLAKLIAALRARLAATPPNSPDASQGEAYLAEALAEQAGQLTPASLALFQQSLRDAPAAASWRDLDQRRLAEAASQ